MVRILIKGRLRAATVYGTNHPVLCLTELSEHNYSGRPQPGL